jgi:hypothetical protein
MLLTNTIEGLKPKFPSDKDEKKKLKIGEDYWADIRKARNYLFLKKFMALIKIGMLNSKSVEMPFDVYRRYALIKSGYYHVYSTPKGSYVEADSIAFENMEEEKFQEVYSRALDFIIEDTQATKEDIEKNLLNFF